MGKRRKAREIALQILFQLEFDESRPEQTISQFWNEKGLSAGIQGFSGLLVRGVLSHKKEIDEIIQSVSEHWRISRMALVDRNILRLAAFELMHGKDLAPAIVIDEAIEIAKKYSSDQAVVFVNGILDALNKKLTKAEKPAKEDKDGGRKKN